MASELAADLLKLLTARETYGRPLVGWTGQTETYGAPGASTTLGPLDTKPAAAFTDHVYFLVSIGRPVRVYRGYETKGLKAPFGIDHPSYIHGLVDSRSPGTPKGWWWAPGRPSKSIDNLGLSSMHRADDRDRTAIKLEWNRIDYYLEAELPIGALVYIGRTAPQHESAPYGRQQYGGGAIQFLLTDTPEKVFAWMKRYVAQ